MNYSNRSALLPLLVSGVALLAAKTALADEVFLIQEVPDPVALADIMYPSNASASKPQYKLRGIRFKKPEVAVIDEVSVEQGAD